MANINLAAGSAMHPVVNRRWFRLSRGLLVETIEKNDKRIDEAKSRMNKKEVEVFEIEHGALSGYITEMYQTTSFQQDNFNINFDTENQERTIPFKEGGRCWTQMMELLPNVDLSKPIKIEAKINKFKVDGELVIGTKIVVTQDGKYVPSYFKKITYNAEGEIEKSEYFNKYPVPPKPKAGGNKLSPSEWKEYSTKTIEFLSRHSRDVEIERIKDFWELENSKKSEEVLMDQKVDHDGGDSKEDLPF